VQRQQAAKSAPPLASSSSQAKAGNVPRIPKPFPPRKSKSETNETGSSYHPPRVRVQVQFFTITALQPDRPCGAVRLTTQRHPRTRASEASRAAPPPHG
jgi:hypothetical protein